MACTNENILFKEKTERAINGEETRLAYDFFRSTKFGFVPRYITVSRQNKRKEINTAIVIQYRNNKERIVKRYRIADKSIFDVWNQIFIDWAELLHIADNCVLRHDVKTVFDACLRNFLKNARLKTKVIQYTVAVDDDSSI